MWSHFKADGQWNLTSTSHNYPA